MVGRGLLFVSLWDTNLNAGHFRARFISGRCPSIKHPLCGWGLGYMLIRYRSLADCAFSYVATWRLRHPAPCSWAQSEVLKPPLLLVFEMIPTFRGRESSSSISDRKMRIWPDRFQIRGRYMAAALSIVPDSLARRYPVCAKSSLILMSLHRAAPGIDLWGWVKFS